MQTNFKIQDNAMINGICKSGYETSVSNEELFREKPAVMNDTLAFETARLTKYHISLAFLLHSSTECTFSFHAHYDMIAIPHDEGHVCASEYRNKREFRVKCKQVLEMKERRITWPGCDFLGGFLRRVHQTKSNKKFISY